MIYIKQFQLKRKICCSKLHSLTADNCRVRVNSSLFTFSSSGPCRYQLITSPLSSSGKKEKEEKMKKIESVSEEWGGGWGWVQDVSL